MHTSFVLVGSRRPPIWFRSVWDEVAVEVASLARAAGKPAGVRSAQYDPNTGRSVPFGRLGLDKDSDAKWTHVENDHRQFLHTEVWVPRWSRVVAEGPGLFIDFATGYLSVQRDSRRFNQIVHIAVSDELRSRIADQIGKSIAVLFAAIGGILAATRRAEWNSHGDCIQDLVTNHLRGLKQTHEDAPRFDMLGADFHPYVLSDPPDL